MAYAEKRGRSAKPWRVKYKLPSGIETSESGFETKAAALTWGRDQEARIREGRWTDPNAGKITVSEWIDRWMTLQDVGLSTVENREYLIRRFIRPSFGASELGSLTTEDITGWENSIPARTGVSRRVARDARAVLCTILGDAAAAKPPLIPYNPAIRPRNRGRRTGRKLDRGPQRVWATPLQALLVAERAALLSGRDDDFTMLVTIAYTGMRWGETIGLERDLRPRRRDPRRVAAPGDQRAASTGSRRRTTPTAARTGNRCLPVDLPPFLAELLRPADQGTAPAAVRLRRPARRQRAVRVPRPGRRPPPAQQLRPARVPPGLRRPVPAAAQQAAPADHRGRLGVAGHPGHHLGARPARRAAFTRPGAGASGRSPRTSRSPAGSRSSTA